MVNHKKKLSMRNERSSREFTSDSTLGGSMSTRWIEVEHERAKMIDRMREEFGWICFLMWLNGAAVGIVLYRWWI
jgi:hypothetical protein